MACCLKGLNNLFVCKGRDGFHPLCNDACHDGASHAGACLHGPGIVSALPIVTCHIGVGDVVIGVKLGIEAVEGSCNVGAWRKDIRLDVP